MTTHIERVALVTGAARGIGRATVEALCSDGLRVLALDSCVASDTKDYAGIEYSLASTEELMSLQDLHPGQVVAQVVDVRDRAEMNKTADLAVSTFGRLDVAVAAAAIISGGEPLWQTPETHLRALLDIDVIGVWNTAAAVVPHMLKGPDPSGCRFVGIASVAGTRGLHHLAAYSAAKHAVVGLIRGLAADLDGTGVTAVAVSPGSTRTQMLTATAKIYGMSDPEEFASSQLVQRLLQPAEIAKTIAFCCSMNGAALNGSVVEAHGGFTR